MRKAAKIILVNPENKILLQLRDNKPTIIYPDYWATIGGEMEDGETPLQGLKREIKEEISSEVSDIEFVGDFSDEEVGFRLFLFKGKVNDKIEDIKFTEGQKLGFFSIQEIEGLKMYPLTKNFILKNRENILS